MNKTLIDGIDKELKSPFSCVLYERNEKRKMQLKRKYENLLKYIILFNFTSIMICLMCEPLDIDIFLKLFTYGLINFIVLITSIYILYKYSVRFRKKLLED